jgi:RNA polymerase sigma factor for flagellar operon FliA
MPETPDTRDRNSLVEAYRSYAKAIAADAARKFNAWQDRPELDSAADLGLVEAATAFDPGRGVQFTTFSYYRIRGAVYDYLRKAGSKLSLFETSANDYLADVSTEGQQSGPGKDIAEIRNIAGNLVTCHLMSLDATTQQIADTSEDSPEEQVLQNERRTALRRAMDQLPAKKKQVLEDYYYRGMSLDEIGKGLGLSRSRVCRIHAKTLEQVREIMQQSAAGPRIPPSDNAGTSNGAAAKMRMGEAGARPVKRGGQLSGARYDNPIVKP